MFPARGPSVLRVVGIETPIARGALDAPTVGTPFVWRWPHPWQLGAIIFGVASNVAGDLAATEVQIFDQRGDAVIGSDGRFPQSVPLLGFNRSNVRFRPSRIFTPMQRKFRFIRNVDGGDRWTIQFQVTDSPSATVKPRLYFCVGDP